MTTMHKGMDAVAVSLANTLALYLNTEIDAINADWNDAATVPALAHPRKIFSERRLVVPELPAIIVGMLPQRQMANGAYGTSIGWAPMDYEFEIILWFRGDQLHILERQGRRYVTALWETIRPAESLKNRPVTLSASPTEVRHSFEGYLKIDRGAQPPHCGVGHCSFTGWFRYAPAGLPDVLKIWLQAPACPKLRCVANFEQRLEASGTG